MSSDLWASERHQDTLEVKYKVERELFSGKSDFQSVKVFQTKGHGNMLLNDDIVMTCERDEFVYHEMIAHVPLLVHPDPKHVLVIGGGDGGTVREVLRHASVQKCVMVEIDKMVVDACREHIEVCSKELINHQDNPRLELLFEDGIKYAKDTRKKFDVVLVDSSDPIGPATPLFGPEFYSDLHRILADDGIVVAQGESPWYEEEMQRKLLEMKGNLFPIVTCYNYSNLTYPGGPWTFTFGSKKYHPLNDYNEGKWRDLGLECRYYNPAVHRAAFALPQFQLNNMGDLQKGF